MEGQKIYKKHRPVDFVYVLYVWKLFLFVSADVLSFSLRLHESKSYMG